MNNNIIPVLDLFAGPGGLGEGFSSFTISDEFPFKIKLSIEKDESAHKTLHLRAFYRFFRHKQHPVPSEYYQYIAGQITIDVLFNKFPEAKQCADAEAICAELGGDRFSDKFFDDKIKSVLGGHENWLLIGGPPCQAYSLVGRSRMLGALKDEHGQLINEGQDFFEDHRHKLYQQYLRIIAKYSPSVFVMENVKGILSSKLDGKHIFPVILNDLKNPAKAAGASSWGKISKHTYHVVSFVSGNEPDNNKKYLIKSEAFGIPQARHRVILLGIRDDVWEQIGCNIHRLRRKKKYIPVADTIDDLPKIRSGLSKRKNSDTSEWKQFLSDAEKQSWFSGLDISIKKAIKKAKNKRTDTPLDKTKCEINTEGPKFKPKWFIDKKLKLVCNHESRTHMDSDLYRYLFVSAFGAAKKASPTLRDFPVELLPDHKNISKNGEVQKFADRFKVQVKNKPSSTITSHISKDGHYFIHPDPVQCRSLTVREAARIQTFPDNYFFEGNKTQQYHQVGNAVPPLLAFKLAAIVHTIFQEINK